MGNATSTEPLVFSGVVAFANEGYTVSSVIKYESQFLALHRDGLLIRKHSEFDEKRAETFNLTQYAIRPEPLVKYLKDYALCIRFFLNRQHSFGTRLFYLAFPTKEEGAKFEEALSQCGIRYAADVSIIAAQLVQVKQSAANESAAAQSMSSIVSAASSPGTAPGTQQEEFAAFCSKCGAKNTKMDPFCSSCGQSTRK